MTNGTQRDNDLKLLKIPPPPLPDLQLHGRLVRHKSQQDLGYDGHVHPSQIRHPQVKDVVDHNALCPLEALQFCPQGVQKGPPRLLAAHVW